MVSLDLWSPGEVAVFCLFGAFFGETGSVADRFAGTFFDAFFVDTGSVVDRFADPFFGTALAFPFWFAGGFVLGRCDVFELGFFTATFTFTASCAASTKFFFCFFE